MKHISRRVSVPLSGLLFLNFKSTTFIIFTLYSFRPLIGVIISKHNANSINTSTGNLFPSPYRGYYF